MDLKIQIPQYYHNYNNNSNDKLYTCPPPPKCFSKNNKIFVDRKICNNSNRYYFDWEVIQNNVLFMKN
jgi:hypothetical protein